MNQTARVLDGIKVLDVATMIFGPVAPRKAGPGPPVGGR
jgi:hypothetical protein